MIKHNANYQATRPTDRLDPVPAGAYVAGIIGAKSEDTGSGERLTVQVEIIEGEFTGYYKKLYDSQSGGQYAARYKGTYSVPIPDGTPADAWKERRLNGLIYALEDSNPGYKWDWDETKLKGKTVGINVRERDWIMEDGADGYRTGTTTEIGALVDANKVREGKIKPMRKRELSDADREKLEGQAAEPVSAEPAATSQSFIAVDTELPF